MPCHVTNRVDSRRGSRKTSRKDGKTAEQAHSRTAETKPKNQEQQARENIRISRCLSAFKKDELCLIASKQQKNAWTTQSYQKLRLRTHKFGDYCSWYIFENLNK